MISKFAMTGSMGPSSCEVRMTDFCYSFPALNRVLTQSEVMDRVMARLGASPLEAIRRDQGASWYEARTRCIACTVDRECRLWLEVVDDASDHEMTFCPNWAFFNLCRPHAQQVTARNAPVVPQSRPLATRAGEDSRAS